MNKRVMAGAVVILIALYVIPRIGSDSKAGPLEYRLVYIHRTLARDSDVDDIRDLAERAARHGYTGIVFASEFDSITLQPPEYFRRLGEVKSVCDAWGLDIIPSVFAAGYGSRTLRHNPNLAAAVPVRDATYVVRDRAARPFQPDRVWLANGALEDADGDRLKDFKMQDAPGSVSYVDREQHAEGRQSLRIDMDRFRDSDGGLGRLMQEIDVEPFHTYRVSCWMRTRRLKPVTGIMLQVRTPEGRVLQSWQPLPDENSEWTQVVTGFNSLDFDRVRIYVGVWDGTAGNLWIDGLSVEAVGPINILRRPGTPVTVKSAASGQVYEEGVDFETIVDPDLNYRFDHNAPPIRLTRGSRIGEGDKLLVSYYQGISLMQGQMPLCLAEPEVYRLWREALELIHDTLDPAGYLLAMDEVREGGWCRACEADGMSAAERLGACITKEREIIAAFDPDASVFVWSDMLDPHHNAHDDYYLYKGDFSGSWEHIPQDLIIACWYYDKRKASLRHFDTRGFRTIACAYYDHDDLDDVDGWMGALASTKHGCGIMYTTWMDKYDLLEPFGDLVTGRQ